MVLQPTQAGVALMRSQKARRRPTRLPMVATATTAFERSGRLVKETDFGKGS